jgi:cell wall-associated NlpC family hydrolase
MVDPADWPPYHPAMSAAVLPRPRRSLSSPVIGFALMLWATVPARAQRAEAVDEAKPFTALSASVHTFRDSLVAVARAQIGTKYVRGGTTPEHGFDCSGLVRYVMASLAVHMPRTARQQAASGTAIARDAKWLRPGDLLTFGKDARGASHVGIYVGDGRYVHASSTAGRVIESDLGRTSSPLVRAWRGVRRIVSGSAADSTRLADGG